MSLTPAREQRRAADPAASVWVAASAGSGKTKVLVDRVLNLLLAGTKPGRILCLTFTKAAAAEMANRIAERLSLWATVSDQGLEASLAELSEPSPDEATRTRARRLFTEVLDAPGGMKIQTIHAFCQALLKRFPLEAGIAPHFEVMDDRDSAEVMAAARDHLLELARLGGDPSLAAALAGVTARIHETNFPELVEAITKERGRLRRMIERHGGVEGLISATRVRLGVAEEDTEALVMSAACAETSFDGPGLRDAAQTLLFGKTTDVERGKIMNAWLAKPEERRAETFTEYGLAYFTTKDEVRTRLITSKLDTDFPLVKPSLEAELERLLRVRERLNAIRVAQATEALLRLSAALLDAYRQHKEARALLDYDDLILTARRLLEGHGKAAWVLYKLDGGLDHLLIDEAQDTSPDQWAVVEALTGEFFAGRGSRSDTVRTVFAVGDRKQSIYSFQGADPVAFEAMRALLRDKVQTAGARWDDVPLNISFRSTRAVLDAVDQVFAQNPARDGVALDGEDIRHVDWRVGQGGLVEVWPPVESRPADAPPAWKPPVERLRGDSPETRLAEMIAQRIEAMIRTGERLASRNRPIRPGDILVLVRRRRGFVDDLVRALKKLHVPVAGADRMVLAEQMAIMDLAALGRLLLLPDDDLTLATVLKGPLIGLSEEELYALARPRGRRSLWAALRDHDDDGTAYAAAFATLSELLRLTDHLSPHELYAHVLGPLGGRRLLSRRLGLDAVDAIDEFMALTLAYEAGHTPSLQGFLHWIEDSAAEVKRDLDQGGGNAVRIMTVHGAKGLQAPIVFLPDTLQAPIKGPSLLWEGKGAESLVFWPPRRADEDQVCRSLREAANLARDREYRRLLYVAMTRAEDRLYVCGFRTPKAPPDECWYNLIKTAVARFAVAVEDPPLLRFVSAQTAEPEQRIEQDRLPANVAALREWALAPPRDEPKPPRPLAPSRPDDDEPVVRSPFGSDGPRFRRGLLIHRLLQSLPDVEPGRRAAVARRYLDRAASDWLPATREATLAEVLAVLAHPAAAPLFGPGSRAEAPVVGLVGGRVVSGQVDRLVVTETTVLIADYKTNRPPPARAEDVAPLYLRQMAAYRAALEQIYPGRTVNCLLVWTDGPSVMPLDEERDGIG